MKFPFIMRMDHDEIVFQLYTRIKTLEMALEHQTARIKEKDQEIESLVHQLVSRIPGFGESRQEGVKREHIITGRGGWRARAQKASTDTIKAPPDSAKQLEDKVKKEGGTV